MKRRLAILSLWLVVDLGCATRADLGPTTEPAATSTAAIRAGDPKMLDSAIAVLAANGSECAFLPDEPGVVVCDLGRNGYVPLVMLQKGPRLFLINHYLKANGVDCEQGMPRLNEINEKFDNLTLICAQHLSFRSAITLGEAGLTDHEVFAFIDEFRREVEAIVRAGALAGIAKD